MSSPANETLQVSTQDVYFTVRSLFYLIAPSETYYKNSEDVPNITNHV